MEDAHATVLSLDDPKAARPAAGTPDANPAFFAVYDGHGGASPHRSSPSLSVQARRLRASPATPYISA